MYTVGYANPGGKGAKAVDGQPGWQSGGSYLTPEGENLTDEIAKAGYLRTVQDWIIRPQLRTISGVAGVYSIGGYAKTFVVEPDPVKLSNYGISYSELGEALENANLAVGANFFNRAGEAYLVRADARIRSVEEIRNAVAATRGGVPITVGQIATVKVGGDLRTGAASMSGDEAVVGTALMLIGENSRIVAKAVGDKLDQIAKTLPHGVKVQVVLDRAKLVNATVITVERNLTEGAILVAAALFLLLGNWRAAIIAVLVIPFSFLMMAMGMNAFRVPGNLMSLGAPAAVGFICLAGVAVLNGLVVMTAIRERLEAGLALTVAIREGAGDEGCRGQCLMQELGQDLGRGGEHHAGREILHRADQSFVAATRMFDVPDVLEPFVPDVLPSPEEEDDAKTENGARRRALEAPFAVVEKYDRYVRGVSPSDTPQGVKSPEFPRVMVVLSDK